MIDLSKILRVFEAHRVPADERERSHGLGSVKLNASYFLEREGYCDVEDLIKSSEARKANGKVNSLARGRVSVFRGRHSVTLRYRATGSSTRQRARRSEGAAENVSARRE